MHKDKVLCSYAFMCVWSVYLEHVAEASYNDNSLALVILPTVFFLAFGSFLNSALSFS